MKYALYLPHYGYLKLCRFNATIDNADIYDSIESAVKSIAEQSNMDIEIHEVKVIFNKKIRYGDI